MIQIPLSPNLWAAAAIIASVTAFSGAKVFPSFKNGPTGEQADNGDKA